MVQQVVWQGPHFPWLCVIMSSSQSGVYSSHIHSVTYCCFLGVFQEMTLMKTSLLWISLGECGEACSLMLLKPMELVISAVMASERCIPCHRCYLHRQKWGLQHCQIFSSCQHLKNWVPTWYHKTFLCTLTFGNKTVHLSCSLPCLECSRDTY